MPCIPRTLFSLVLVAALACGGDDAADDTQGGTSPQTSSDTDPTAADSGATDPASGSGMADAGGTSGTGGPADSTDDDGGSGDSGGQSGWEACGIDPPTGPGDSVEPEHPDSPAIVAACTDLCTAWAAVPACTVEMATCVADCQMRTCGVCPGTLAPLVACEATNFDETACTCGESGPTCPIPDACETQEQETGFCGG